MYREDITIRGNHQFHSIATDSRLWMSVPRLGDVWSQATQTAPIATVANFLKLHTHVAINKQGAMPGAHSVLVLVRLKLRKLKNIAISGYGKLPYGGSFGCRWQTA